MPYYKFGPDDLFYNRLDTKPQINFKIYDGSVFYSNQGSISGAWTNNDTNVPVGSISLYELNVDRPSDQLIYPFITKDGSLTSFSTVSTTAFNNDFQFGDEIKGSYPLSASISSDRYIANHDHRRISALRTALDSYQVLSPAYAYSSSLGYWRKNYQELRLISIPSIFYGSSIEKGTVSLKFYITGTLFAELKDSDKDGELKQTTDLSGTSHGTVVSGTVGGVVLYNEGFIILTGSWDLTGTTGDIYIPGESATEPRWIDFGGTGSVGQMTTSSYEISFSGSQYIPTLTMLAQAPQGQINYSNNPTFISSGSNIPSTPPSGSLKYVEPASRTYKNIGSSSFSDTVPTFQKTVFVSKIGVYDKDKNLIAIATLANPIRKRNNDDLTFKLKLDF